MERAPTPPESYVDVRGVATHLRTTKAFVYDAVWTKGLPHVFVGRYLRFKLSLVDAWVRDGQARLTALPRGPRATATPPSGGGVSGQT